VKLETGPAIGTYFYTRDHLGSIREVTDASGTVRARYTYDPYGRRVRVAGDVDADFGFAGMFWSAEAGLALTRFRAYDPDLGRWCSRDPLPNAEVEEGPNLYAYVGNNPLNLVDPLGLSPDCVFEKQNLQLMEVQQIVRCRAAKKIEYAECELAKKTNPEFAWELCAQSDARIEAACAQSDSLLLAMLQYLQCKNAVKVPALCPSPAPGRRPPPPPPAPRHPPFGGWLGETFSQIERMR
jgi:RHS repeat-associated protein